MALLVIPNTFTAGAVISSTEMNTNFAAVQAAVNAIDSDKLVDGAVTAGKIGSSAVTEAKIASGAVSADKLASNAVTTAKILDANVTSGKLASGAALANIGTGGLTATYIGAGAVTETKLGSSAVTAAKIASGAVTPAKTSFASSLDAGGGIYAGYVAYDAGAASVLPSGWSVSRDSTGIYRLTHNLGLSSATKYSLVAMPISSGTGYTAMGDSAGIDGNEAVLFMYNFAALTNVGFWFILVAHTD